MEILNAVESLGALAHESRLEIYRLLVQQGPEGLPAGQIGKVIQIPPATLSFHLAHLQRSGLIASRKLSRQILYSVNFKAMTNLLAFLTENCCQAATLEKDNTELCFTSSEKENNSC